MNFTWTMELDVLKKKKKKPGLSWRKFSVHRFTTITISFQERIPLLVIIMFTLEYANALPAGRHPEFIENFLLFFFCIKQHKNNYMQTSRASPFCFYR